jgi:hypothetical protein
MEWPAKAALFTLLFYVPGLFVGLAELEIEELGDSFWAANLKSNKNIPLPWHPTGPGKTLTTYHLMFFTALLTVTLSGFTAVLLFSTQSIEEAGQLFLAVLSVFILICVVEDNTWYTYRNNKTGPGFSPWDRAVRYTVGTLISFGLFLGSQCSGGDCGEPASVFWTAVGFYAAANILVDQGFLVMLYTRLRLDRPTGDSSDTLL